METISLKLEEGLLGEVDQRLKKYRYSTRTEFIRDAIREKLSDLEKDEILMSIAKLKGSSIRKTTNEQLHAAREKAFDEIEKRFKAR